MNTYAPSMNPMSQGYGNQPASYGYSPMPSMQEQYMAKLQQMEAQRQQYYGSQQSQTVGQQMAWVNGIEGAKAYIIPPNSRIILMDSDADFMYIKESDVNGHMTFKKFKYEEAVENETAPIDTTKYVTIDEFDKIKDELKKLQTALGIDNDKNGGVVVE